MPSARLAAGCLGWRSRAVRKCLIASSSVARTTNQQVLFGNPSVYPAFTLDQAQWTAFANINWTHIASATLINELSWSWQHAEGDAPIGRGEIPRINVPGIVSYGQGLSDAVFIQNNQQWRNVTTWKQGVALVQVRRQLQLRQRLPRRLVRPGLGTPQLRLQQHLGLRSRRSVFPRQYRV